MLDLREEILDHYKHPRNYGVLEGVSSASQINASCGDRVEFYLKVEDGVIKEVSWQGEGCSISRASASMLSEKLLGKKYTEVVNWGEVEMREMLGEINPGRTKCMMLPLVAVKGLVRPE